MKTYRQRITRGVALVLCLCLFLTSASTLAYGMEDQRELVGQDLQRFMQTASAQDLKKLSNEQLQDSAKLTLTEAQAELVFNELLYRNQIGVLTTQTLIDAYLDVTSSEISGTSLTISYKITAKIPVGATISLGYRYASSRVNGSVVSLSNSTKVGSYTKTFSNVVSPLAHQVYAKLTARNYSVTNVYDTYYITTQKVYNYHTVTAAEVTGYYLLYHVAPYAAIKIYPGDKLIKAIAKAITIAGTVITLFDDYDIATSFPTPKVGHYHETATWYADNSLHIANKVWQSKDSFQNGDIPIFSGSYSIQLPDFP